MGAGLAVAPNALRALDVIGVGDEVRKLSAIQGQSGVRLPDGRWLARTIAEDAAARYGDPIVLLTRSALVGILAGRLPHRALRVNTPVESVDPATGRVVVAGTAEAFEADLVVAADGIRSRIRSALFPGHPAPVYAGVTSWRAIVPLPGVTGASETWGRGLIFGVMPLAGGQVYCYATATVPPGLRAADERTSCSGCSAAGTTRSRHCWRRPTPRPCSATTSTASTSRCPPSTGDGSRCWATPPIP